MDNEPFTSIGDVNNVADLFAQLDRGTDRMPERIASLELQPVRPDGWYVKTSVTLLRPDGQANIIASSEPLDRSIDTDTYARVQGDLLRNEFPAFVEHAFDTVELAGVRAMWRLFSWTPPDGVAVTQLQLYATTPGRGHTATATTPSTRWDELEEVFFDAIRAMIVARDGRTAF